ncbi:helix-turn-helix domain-containing protein [Haemophilus parainfluenzae]|uniref:helix-turn-helix domain-containing protein n=1 Tax=Haemophilus parainfluenzae TaxID=729 RepID=UPI00080A8774|nr:helix-turn-helix domain-containing protein [Haemophilus parainfluenzae]MDU3503772.1 helix-turn-helix domain-containing protein [Haemophilus parainfluenzae]
MSMRLMVQAMNCEVGNPARKLVLLKLADNANDDGVCFPSYQYIADKCEMSKRSAISHIDDLIKMGFVTKKARKNKDGSSANLYLLHLEQGSEKSALGGEKSALGGEKSALGGGEKSAPITSHSFNLSINRISDDEISANAEHADEKTKTSKRGKISVDYQGVMNAWNEVFNGSPIHLLKTLSPERKKAILKVAKTMLETEDVGSCSVEVFKEYFKDFLNQANSRANKFFFGGLDGNGWVAKFKYIMRPETFLNTFEDSL